MNARSMFSMQERCLKRAFTTFAPRSTSGALHRYDSTESTELNGWKSVSASKGRKSKVWLANWAWLSSGRFGTYWHCSRGRSLECRAQREWPSRWWWARRAVSLHRCCARRWCFGRRASAHWCTHRGLALSRPHRGRTWWPRCGRGGTGPGRTALG